MENRERIGSSQAAMMVALAGAVDAIQALLTFLIIGLFANGLISLLSSLAFYLWFKLNDVTFLDGQAAKAVVFLGGTLIEQIPGLNALPAATLTVILTIAIVKREDARYNKEQQ